MQKIWRLRDTISDRQIHQLYSAGIDFNIESDIERIEMNIRGNFQILKSNEITLTTVDEKQETLLFLMFDVNRLEHTGTVYDENHAWIRSY
jgi:hypothetical protein